MRTARNIGRMIAALLLLQMLCGAFGNFVLVAPVFAAPGFLVNAAAHPLNMSLSLIVGLAASAASIGVAISAWPILRRSSETAAFWLLAMAVTNLTLAAVEQTAMLSLLSLSQAYAAADGADGTMFLALRGVVAANHNWAHYVHLMVGGGFLLVLFGALWRFALVPRFLGGFGVLASLLQIVAVSLPAFGQPVNFLMIAPLGIAMIATVVWLLVRSIDERHLQPISAAAPGAA